MNAWILWEEVVLRNSAYITRICHIYRHQCKGWVFGRSLQMHALKVVFGHHHWRTIHFWKIVLESHYGMPRILSLMMGDKKALFYYLLFFWKSNNKFWKFNCRRWIWQALAIYLLQWSWQQLYYLSDMLNNNADSFNRIFLTVVDWLWICWQVLNQGIVPQ